MDSFLNLREIYSLKKEFLGEGKKNKSNPPPRKICQKSDAAKTEKKRREKRLAEESKAGDFPPSFSHRISFFRVRASPRVTNTRPTCRCSRKRVGHSLF